MEDNLLKQRIISRIKSEGPINFETFMEMALYYPGLGYYLRKTTRIGRRGDFYTSPHLHPLFGAVIGRVLFDLWRTIEKSSFQVVEIGAGEGYLAKDILDYVSSSADLIDFFQILSYKIIESNHYLRARQESLLGPFSEKVRWMSKVSELDSFTGCFLSNELLDSFPIRLIEMDNKLSEIYISVDDRGDLTEIKRTCSKEVLDYLEEFKIKIPENYRTEVNLRIKNWLIDISSKLKEGFVITIDYGYPASEYYSEERNRGTLLCYHNHRIEEDPLKSVGKQDITAHVNFSSLKKWGEDVGLRSIGFCEQGPFLVSSGIDVVIKELYGGRLDPFETSRIKSLLMPEGMGESHKVMIQYKGKREIAGLPCFNLRNRLGWL